MFTFLSLLATFIGAAVLYLTNKNQKIIARPLIKYWRLITIFCWGISLFIWVSLFVVSAAIFIWLFTIIIALTIVPLLSLNHFFHVKGSQ
ncbi:hypothetical protein [Shewanella phaeophyticola]|uniref:Uncharacterized protein n=1 Tax=Shewanella phaeophyticola TaxID=2978345 RepID=A0ABT2P464_9GAMM|nr:hypothetical protein [Shewanella sp. KJ10-1]MCT8986051.1 hypothetical protein [Shewanella sp. KJ10-1]